MDYSTELTNSHVYFMARILTPYPNILVAIFVESVLRMMQRFFQGYETPVPVPVSPICMHQFFMMKSLVMK